MFKGSESSNKENTAIIIKQSLRKEKEMKKAKITQKVKIGGKELSGTVEFETNTVPECGSIEMFDAIFKSAKTFGTLTKDDEEQVQRDMENFWKSSSSAQTKTKKKTKKSKHTTVVDQSKEKNTNTAKSSKWNDHETSQDTLDLLRAADELLEDTDDESIFPNPCSPYPSSSSCTTRPTRSSPRKRKNGLLVSEMENKQASIPTKKPVIESDIIDLSDLELSDVEGQGPYEKPTFLCTLSDSDEDEIIPEPTKSSELGNMILFQVVLRNQSIPIRMFETQTIQELRAIVAKKSGLDQGCIDMFLGTDMKLEDKNTILECGINNLCNVDAYYLTKSDKELFMSGSENILRFKLQTSDRRGRENLYVYIKNTSTMQSVADEYAKEMGIKTSEFRLKFDGDILNLSSTPMDCDLEGDECLDVVTISV